MASGMAMEDFSPPRLTAETIKQPHDSHPRNPLIANVLYLATYLEKWGSGVSRIIEACKQQGIPEPTFEDRGGFIHIVFKRKAFTLSNDTPNETQEIKNEPQSEPQNRQNDPQNEPQNAIFDKLSKRQCQIMSIINSSPKTTKDEMAQMLNISESTIARDLKQINKHIVVIWVGPSKGGHWEIKD